MRGVSSPPDLAAAIPPGPFAGRIWLDPAKPARNCAVRQLTNYRGHSHHLAGRSPCWLDGGRRLVLVSDREGCGNLFAYDFAVASLTQLTDLRGTERPTDVEAATGARLIFRYDGEVYELDCKTLWLRRRARQAPRMQQRKSRIQRPVVRETIAVDGRRFICLGNSRRPLVESRGSGRAPFAATAPCLSPDGQHVMFVSDADGYAQVYTVGVPAAENLALR